LPPQNAPVIIAEKHNFFFSCLSKVLCTINKHAGTQELVGYAKRGMKDDLPDGVRQLAGSADLPPALVREPGWAGVGGG